MRNDIQVGGLCIVSPEGRSNGSFVAKVENIADDTVTIRVGDGPEFTFPHSDVVRYRIQGMLYNR